MDERRFFERYLPIYAALWKESNWVIDYKRNDEQDLKAGQAYIHTTPEQDEIILDSYGLKTSQGFQSTYNELVFEPLPIPGIKSVVRLKKELAAKWKFRLSNSETHEIVELPYSFGQSISGLLSRHSKVKSHHEKRKDMIHPEYRCFCRTCMVYKRCNSQSICRICGDILEEKAHQ